MTTATERQRLRREESKAWRKWGPYLAERAWGTVREDYSALGNPWGNLTHDQARSKAYRWGEDGIAGFCDRYQILCWSLALWNGRDPILKERLFGLVPDEANHGEDVKECYFYVDALPSHSYQKLIYKYPQAAFPYEQLVRENVSRSPAQPEYELLDTGVFDGNRYFDVVVEIAKASPEEILFRVTAHNRGPEPAPLHVIPQLWFRNVWSWGAEPRPQPTITPSVDGRSLLADDSTAPPLEGLLADCRLGPHVLEFEDDTRFLFTNNDSNLERLYGVASANPFVKDAFHRAIVNGEIEATNPARKGTKACAWFEEQIPPGGSQVVRMRLRPADQPTEIPWASFDSTLDLRKREADEFYESVHPPTSSAAERNIQRQAFAGMLWSKQIYLFDVEIWLDGDRQDAPPPSVRKLGRNRHWRHLNSMRVLSMPDTWEYPWFAAWDLAFHAVVLALIDAEFAKEQLWLMLFEQFQHPNGQIPAYEWEFCDLNPPVHAWAVWRVYNMDRIRSGHADRDFLERCFHKLLLNFTWWVNRVDTEGNNVFEGGFLGLDNITLFDRSKPLPNGATLEQSDGTGWMGMFSLVMMRIALELAKENATYEGLATKFFEHYVYIGAAMKMERGSINLWDPEDNFFHDVLRMPDGTAVSFRVRSLVGLIPLYAIERLEQTWIEPFAVFRENLNWFLEHRREIVGQCVTPVAGSNGITQVLAVVNRDQLSRLLGRVSDTAEFLSEFGVRSLSRYHAEHPFVFGHAVVRYEPAEASEKLKGGNSNWRGPIWFPTSFLMIESLRKLEKAFSGEVQVQVDGEVVTLSGFAADVAERMIRIFIPDEDGYRPLYGPRGTRKGELFARDPHWKDLVLFHEYFNGDTGEGLGASHQTGWTGLVANLIDEWRK